jgi:phosphate transport system substrate-binding protein
MRVLTSRTAKFATLTGLVALVLATLVAPALAAVTITGAGATFPAPLYYKWANDWKAKTGNKVNYQAIGSGGGISAIKAGTVLFGGSDAPLTAGELSGSGLVQFPTCIGGVVPIVNLPGIGNGKLKLTGPVLADIFLGKITKWNAGAIKSLNPGVNLPSTNVLVVHRSDASGTSWIFTHYLSAVSSTWAGKVGADKSVRWPVGVAGKGNEGVAALVKQSKGRIGYVEYAYAVQSRIAYAQMKNKAGKFVLPSLGSFSAAASGASWSPANGFGTIMVNAAGSSSWPIAGASFVIVKKNTSNYANAHAMLQFFDWAYRNASGRADASRLQYVSMPLTVVGAVEKVWHAQVKAAGKAAW